MFEVIISNINTGRVERQSFASRDQANKHADQRVTRLAGKRSHANYRVEIHQRELSAPARPVLDNAAAA